MLRIAPSAFVEPHVFFRSPTEGPRLGLGFLRCALLLDQFGLPGSSIGKRVRAGFNWRRAVAAPSRAPVRLISGYGPKPIQVAFPRSMPRTRRYNPRRRDTTRA